jgi:hypothetical protein
MKATFALSGVPGFQSRSLIWQRRAQARERTSDGQPENIVGRFCASTQTLKHPELKYELWCTEKPPCITRRRNLWERGRECGGSGNINGECQSAIASRLTPTGIASVTNAVNIPDHCGSEPARDDGLSGTNKNGTFRCRSSFSVQKLIYARLPTTSAVRCSSRFRLSVSHSPVSASVHPVDRTSTAHRARGSFSARTRLAPSSVPDGT